MKFEQLKRRVIRAETLVEGRRQQTIDQAAALLRHWKQGWTPWRIVAVGLGLGFLSGHTHPTRAIGATKWLRALSTVSGMLTSLQAALAAWQADQASDQANDAAGNTPAAAAESTQQATTAESHATDSLDEEAAAQAERHAATTRAAGMATADDGGHGPARDVSSYGRSTEGRGETEHWAAHPPRPAEAATDVSER